MKVRIGVSLGPAGTPEAFADAVDLLEQAGVDSLWLPENVYSPLVEPFTGMAFALSRTRRLKAGSGVSVLPGRHPVLVAKQLASLAGLAPGRVLPVFGVLPAQPAERVLFPVPDGKPLAASIHRRRPDADPATLVAAGWDGARRMIGQYVEAGLSKFVVRPASPGPFGPFFDGFVRELLPLQN